MLIRTLQILGFHVNPLEPVQLMFDSDSSGVPIPRPGDCQDRRNISAAWSTLSLAILIFEIIGVVISFNRIEGIRVTGENTVILSVMILWIVFFLISHLIGKISIVFQTSATRSFINNLVIYHSIHGSPIKMRLKTTIATALFVCLLFYALVFEIQFENEFLRHGPSQLDRFKLISNAIAWISYYASVMVLPLFNIIAINLMKIHLAKPLSILNFFNTEFNKMANKEQYLKSRANIQLLKKYFKEFSTDSNFHEDNGGKSKQFINNHERLDGPMQVSTDLKIDLVAEKPSVNRTQIFSQRNKITSLLPATLSADDIRFLERIVLDSDEMVGQYMSTYGIGLLCHTIMHVGGLTCSGYVTVMEILNKSNSLNTAIYLIMSSVHLLCLHLPAEQYNRVVSQVGSQVSQTTVVSQIGSQVS